MRNCRPSRAPRAGLCFMLTLKFSCSPLLKPGWHRVAQSSLGLCLIEVCAAGGFEMALGTGPGRDFLPTTEWKHPCYCRISCPPHASPHGPGGTSLDEDFLLIYPLDEGFCRIQDATEAWTPLEWQAVTTSQHTAILPNGFQSLQCAIPGAAGSDWHMQPQVMPQRPQRKEKRAFPLLISKH